MRKINNAALLEAETYRLKLRQQQLLNDIRRDWTEIKRQGEPALLATEAIIQAVAGKSPAAKIASTAAEMILRYFSKK